MASGRTLHLHSDIAKDIPDLYRFASRRSVVYSSKGMVACSQPIATAVGLEILERGGNAADAAVATSAALNLTEPSSCGIGGDAFCLYFDAKTKEVKALNGSGRAPKALTLAKAKELGLSGVEIPLLDVNSVTVPGCAAAWVDTVESLGSGKLTLSEILAPAIKLAEEGVPISEISSYYWRKSYKHLVAQSPSGHEMLVVDPKTGETHAPGPGERFKNPTLARTFREVAEKGKKGFYEGRIGEAIIDIIKSKGGVMTLEDLKSHTTSTVTPISANYGGPKGVTLHECPPAGQGITALMALGIIDAIQDLGLVDLEKEEHNGVMWLHTLIEALRLAFADVKAYVADPDHVSVPVEELLSKDYLRTRAALFDPQKANTTLKKGAPFASSDTVLFTTSDSEGNACSYIQSNYAGFGSYLVPEGCGFTLQNRGCNFSLQEGHPNVIDGGKRPYHTIIPGLVTRGEGLGGDLFMVYGVMGAFMQPQGHVQVLLNMLHHNHTAQSALDAPRFCLGAGSPDNTDNPADATDIDSEVFLEDGISEDVCAELRKMGHNAAMLKSFNRGTFGKGQIIQRLPDGIWAGGSDPRGDGHAAPQIR